METTGYKNLKVLIVDDVDSISISIEMIVQETLTNRFVYNILIARSYQECMSKFVAAQEEGYPVDLVIMDLNLKGGSETFFYHDGELLLIDLKKINPDLKSIVYSQYDDPHLIRKVIDSTGADAYIVKGANSISDVKKAMHEIFLYGEKYFPENLLPREDPGMKLTDNQRLLISLMKQGYSIMGMSKILSKDPSFEGASVRTLQRKIKEIRTMYQIDKNEDLIPALRKLGVIKD